MLMKAEIGSNESERTFAAWRAMLPHWSEEADRFRKLANAVRAGEPVQLGAFDEAETLVTQIRAAGLSDAAKAEIQAVIARAGGELMSMDNPTSTLEELFLNIVRDSEARPGRRARAEAEQPSV